MQIVLDSNHRQAAAGNRKSVSFSAEFHSNGGFHGVVKLSIGADGVKPYCFLNGASKYTVSEGVRLQCPLMRVDLTRYFYKTLCRVKLHPKVMLRKCSTGSSTSKNSPGR